jgi:protein-S-isoprenylcysteine O-methyltransferase Ste14
VLVLLVLNIPHWFDDPLSPRQLVGWTLLVASGVLVIWSVLAFQRAGRVAAADMPGPEFAFERTAQLLTRGVYRWIRHPMYASLLYLAWGAALKRVTPVTLGVALATTVALYATARFEERENVVRFGDEYGAYMRSTKRFVPWVW